MGGASAGRLARFVQASGVPALEHHFIETFPKPSGCDTTPASCQHLDSGKLSTLGQCGTISVKFVNNIIPIL